jgi:gas vesicle protein
MSFTYGFYNSKDGDRKYDAVQMSSIFDGVVTDGIFETIGGALIVKSSDMTNTVTVQSGRAWFNHTWNYNDSKMPIVNEQGIPAEDCKRYDAVVLDINSNNEVRENKIIWVYGEETTGDPEKPIIIKEDHHWQYPLCYVLRDHEDNGKIIQDVITNCVGTSECPFVTGVVTGLTTDELIAQWDAEWKTYISQYVLWLDDSKQSFQDWLDERYSSFDEWFEKIKDQLSEDVAEKLQIQIDELNKTVDDLNTTIETTVSTQISELKEEVDASLADGKIKFGIDSSGNYGYIKEGADTVTPFKTGNESKVGTATEAQVLTGYTFTNASSVGASGTMANKGAWTGSTTGSGNVTIPAGYHNGSGYVSGSGAYNAGVSAGKSGRYIVKTGTYTFSATKNTQYTPTISTGLSSVSGFSCIMYKNTSENLGGQQSVSITSTSGGNVTLSFYLGDPGVASFTVTMKWIAYGT